MFVLLLFGFFSLCAVSQEEVKQQERAVLVFRYLDQFKGFSNMNRSKISNLNGLGVKLLGFVLDKAKLNDIEELFDVQKEFSFDFNGDVIREYDKEVERILNVYRGRCIVNIYKHNGNDVFNILRSSLSINWEDEKIADAILLLQKDPITQYAVLKIESGDQVIIDKIMSSIDFVNGVARLKITSPEIDVAQA